MVVYYGINLYLLMQFANLNIGDFGLETWYGFANSIFRKSLCSGGLKDLTLPMGSPCLFIPTCSNNYTYNALLCTG